MSEKPKKSKFWKWTKRVLLTLAILAALIVFVGFPTLMAYFITHSRTRPFELRIADTPATFDARFEEIQFTSFNSPEEIASTGNNGVDRSSSSNAPVISGWYLPQDSAKAIIIYVHGLFRSRQEMLERACDLWKHGYAGLIIDFRRHGKSTGELTSMGFLERLDVIAAVQFIKKELHLDLPVVVCSVSMGAAAALLAAAEAPEIDLVIAESSFLSFDNTIAHHAKLILKLPAFPFAHTVSFLTKVWVGFSSEDFDLRIAAQKMGDRPVLFWQMKRTGECRLKLSKSCSQPAQAPRRS